MKYFYDTCALLNIQEKAFDNPFIISSETLKEIEHIKTSRNKDEDIKFRSRNVIKLLDANYDTYRVCVTTNNTYKILDDFNLDITPDNIILANAYYHNKFVEPIVFASDDIACKCIAREIFGLKVIGTDSDKKDIYKGFKEIDISDEALTDLFADVSINAYDCLNNEYLILKQKGQIIDVLKWNEKYYSGLSNKGFKSRAFGNIKPLDLIQKCAFDSIQTNDITALYGKAGSGKTTIPLAYIMQNLETQKVAKCHIVYHYEPLRGARTLGFEKGSHVEKLLNYGSLGNILTSKFGDQQVIESWINAGTLNIIPTCNIRGVEFGSQDVVFCTEAQNLDVYTLKTILQRCKEGCKIILEGDILEQSDINTHCLGLNRMIDVFKGSSKFGCVKLKNNYRSEICELADKM